MSALDELIYDRTQTDVTYAAELNRKLGAGTALTAEEQADWNAGLKGAYNASDMNRVDAAVRELGGMLTAAGYPVEYVDPRKLTSSGVTEIALTSESFQHGKWLYTTGERSDMENYICTNAMIPVVPDKAITARVDIDILSDSGFVWYDADMAYIGGTNSGAPILWGSCFQAIPPANAAYCNINIKQSAVTPADIGTVYVRQVANPESAGLPEEYTQVEYIESHGTEYIDTGFKPDSNTRVICEFMPLDSTKAYGIFGSRTAYLKSAYNLFVGDTGTHFQDDYNNTSTTNVESVANTLYVIDKNKNVSTINGTQNSVAYSSFEVEYSMYLFGVNTSGAVNSAQLSTLRMYSCSIYDNDILVRYYIPCTNSAGIVGLYDTVSGVFYTNAGTGSFTAGADVPPKPETDEWVVGDIINLPVWVQYIQNVRNIIEEYYTMPDSPELPEPTAPLTFDGANAIELLIYDILKLYEGMIKRYRICGTFAAGSDYNRQYIRSV